MCLVYRPNGDLSVTLSKWTNVPKANELISPNIYFCNCVMIFFDVLPHLLAWHDVCIYRLFVTRSTEELCNACQERPGVIEISLDTCLYNLSSRRAGMLCNISIITEYDDLQISLFHILFNIEHRKHIKYMNWKSFKKKFRSCWIWWQQHVFKKLFNTSL